MLDLKKTGGGVSFPVRVTPRASRDQLGEVVDGALKVKLTAPPVEGAANRALIKFMAKLLGVAKGRVKVVSGEKSRRKRLWVQGLSPDQAARRLGA